MPPALMRLAWRWGPRVPGPVVRVLLDAVALVSAVQNGPGVRRLRANLARVRPEASTRELDRLVRRGLRSYMRYFGEVFTLAGATPDQVRARVRLVGDRHLHEAVEGGGSAVLALGHMGNWDLAGVFASGNVLPVLTVAERLQPESLFQEFLRLRESLGMQVLALGDGDVFRELLRGATGGGRLICLLADRDLTRGGLTVELFGEPARVAAGPAALASASGRPLVPVGIAYERLRGARRRAAGTPWGIAVRFHPPVPAAPELPRAARVQAMTQAWVDALAEDIAAHPEDWHMLQRVFVADLDPARLAASAATTPGAAS